MSFLRSQHKKPITTTAHSLRACLGIFRDSHLRLSLLRSSKRASFISSFTRGSMTLEASFVLPFFLFAVLNILFAVNIIGTQSKIQAALHQVGNKIAFAGYAYEKTAGSILPDGLAGVTMTQGYARGQVLESVGKKYLDQSCVKGGSEGVSFAGSSIMGPGDIIDLQVSYQVRPFIELMGFEGFAMSQRYYGKAWTGYDVTRQVSDDSKEDPMVFITESGTVYHLDRNCNYLNPSIESVSAGAVANLRNHGDGRYYACGSCGRVQASGQVYITEYGDSYHSKLNCPGLKRTIYTVPLSQTGGRGRCSKCG